MNYRKNAFLFIAMAPFLFISCFAQSDSCFTAQSIIENMPIKYDLCRSYTMTDQGIKELNRDEEKLNTDESAVEICFIEGQIRFIESEVNYESGDQRAEMSYYLNSNGTVDLRKKEVAFFEQGCLNDEIMYYFEITGILKASSQFSCIYYTDKELNEIANIDKCYLNLNKPKWQLELGERIIKVEDLMIDLKDR